MTEPSIEEILKYISRNYKPHPWHGISLHTSQMDVLHAFVEMVPMDTVKYEMDKKNGYLTVDRPQRYSSILPTLYGFFPHTYCGPRVADYCYKKTKREELVGDEDPLDVCILTEKTITHGDIVVNAIPIGGFRMIDDHEVDDKIIAVLENDSFFGSIRDISGCPPGIIERLRHYFLTYKGVDDGNPKCEITHTYGLLEARQVIELANADYKEKYNYEAFDLSKTPSEA